MNAIDCQLEQYAKDFRVLVGLHRDLEQRYAHLSTSHRQLAGAGEVLRSMSPRSQVLCLVTNRKGDIVQATDRARSLFEQDGTRAGSLQRIVPHFHLSRLNTVFEGQQTQQMQVLTDAPEVLLNPRSDALNGQIYVSSPLVVVNASHAEVYWIVRELNKREQSEIANDPLSTRPQARRSGAVVFDTLGTVVATDVGFQNLVGLDTASIGAATLSTFHSPDHANAAARNDLLEEVRQSGQWQGEISTIADLRLPFLQWMSVSAIEDTDGQVVAYAAQLVDREKMLMAERFLLDAHYHDAATGLPNRKFFKEQAAKKMAAARQSKEQLVLLSIMMDRRQWIRDTHDGAVSDAVVMKVAQRLLALSRGCDLLARVEDDQFLLLLVGPHDAADVALLATQIIKALSEPVTIQFQELQMGGSIGCALFGQDGSDLPTLTKNAESTMRLARKAGGNRYVLFTPDVPASGAVPMPTARSAMDQSDIPTINMELGV